MLTRFQWNGRFALQGWSRWPITVLMLLLAGLFPVRATAGIALVQHASKDAGVTSSSSLAFPASNTAGNWIGVVIRAGHSGQVLTVSDSRGDTFRQAAQFNQTLDAPNGETLAIYYAENITGGTNTVTVSESISNNTLRFAILEYSGVASSTSLDATAAAQGSGTTLNSGNATTTANGDLVLGAVATADGVTYTAGSGYTIEERVPAAPNTKLIAEDEIQAVAGAVSVSAILSTSDNGGALLAAFKAAAGVIPPSISSLSPNSGPVGTSVTITGMNFGSTQGTSTVTFNGVAATPTSWSATSIAVTVPAGATTGNIVVTVGGMASNGVGFMVSVISVSVMPAAMSLATGVSTLLSATVQNDVQGKGVTWSLSGPGCSGTACGTLYLTGSLTTTGYIAPSSVPSPPTVNVTATSVADPTKSGIGTITITLPVPVILSLSPTAASIGASVTITGSNFGAAQGTSSVTFNGAAAASTGWSAGSVTVLVPIGATTGNVVVTVGGVASSGVSFSVIPNIVSLSPASGMTGTPVTISGAGFGAAQLNSLVAFNGTLATPTSWSATSIAVPVPIGASTGNVVVNVGGFTSNGIGFTALPITINGLNPTSGFVGDTITITGTNFGSTQGTSSVTFNGTVASSANWGATVITVPVPVFATSGNVVVTVGGIPSNGLSFMVLPVAIQSLTPASGPVGTSVTITGTNFGATQGTSTVTFGGVAATPTSWSGTSITVPVPTGATTGTVVVTVGGVASNGVGFTVTPPPPSIASLNPTSGLAGTDVTISGANFGATQGTSTVTFGGVAATPTSWSATSIVATVRSATGAGAGASTGPVVVTVSGVASNGVIFTVLPSISRLNPSSGTIGASVTIVGDGFNNSQGTSTVTFNGAPATPTLWSTSSITAAVPSGATTGNVVVTVGGVASNGALLSVIPSISSLNPTSGPVGTSVTITGNGFGTTQGTGTVMFGGAAATPTSWSGTSIIVPVPSAAIAGAAGAVVTVGGFSSNAVNFTVTPSITSLNPTSGPVGTSVTITGTNFGAVQNFSTVTFNGITGTPTSWSATSIAVPVPNGATTGNVVVTTGTLASNGVLFTVTNPGPSTTSLSPTSGPVGASITITGTNFGATQGTSTVTFNGTQAAAASNWSATSIIVLVPAGATTGNVVVTVSGAPSNAQAFTVLPAPNITSLSPASGQVGASITITGTNFGTTQGTSTVTFNGIGAATTSWSATSIVATVPTTTTGSVVVTVNSVASNAVAFTVLPPSITSITPTSGLVGTSVTITGTGFGALTPGSDVVVFNNAQSFPITSWSATSIVVPVPAGATTGNVVVYVAAMASNGVAFTVPPNITGLSPSVGPQGTSVTIRGTSFGTTQGTSSVTFNGATATPTSWSATSIAAPVPAGATTGSVVVTAGGVASNGVNFTVSPTITSLSPTSGSIGTSVAISGTNFGTTQGTSSVTLNGVAATPTSWGAFTIFVPVPVGATTGNVVVTVGGAASNGMPFTVTTVPANITLVQHTSKDAGVTSSSTMAFPSNNIAGNWIGVLIRAGHSGQALNVGDTRGNTYRQAVQFNQTLDAPNGETIAIYYAENVAGGANTVTVSESIANNTLRFAILEYSGVATANSLDVTAAAQGSGTTLSSGNATTTAGGDLLLGMAVAASGVTFTAGSGFTIEERVPAAPNTKLIAQDAIQAVAGVASASATFSPSANGGAALAAFKAASGGGPAGPSITSLNPASGAVGAPVTIAGANFGASQGTSTVTFNGISATPTSWGATSIAVPVPTGATTGNVVVSVGGIASNGAVFTVTPTAPSITSLTPNNGLVGTSVTIAGANFGATQGTSTVTFNGTSATPTSWSATSIAVPVPTGATTGNVVVTVGGIASNGVAFTVTSTSPSITSLNPTNGPVGTSVTITGTNFGASQGTSTVTFNGTSATPTSWSTTSITVPVPTGATTGSVVITVGGVASNGANFSVTVPTSSGITLVQHTSKDAGITASSSLAFTSNNTAGNFIAVVIRGGKASQVFTVSDSRSNTYKQAIQANLTVDGETIAMYYAESIAGGANTVTVSESITNNTLRFAILEYSGVSPSSSLDVTAFAQGSDTEPGTGNTATTAVGDLLIAEMTNAAGTTFGAGSGFTMEEVVPAAPSSRLLVEDGIQALPGVVSGTASMTGLDNWGALLAAFKPATGSAGPHIVDVSPGTAPAGSLVTIVGTNFGTTQGSSTVAFNGTAAIPRSWSGTSILAQVPSGATSGNVVVTVGGTPSNGVNFSVGFAPPIAFVQVNSSQNIETPLPSSLQFVSVPFKGAQTTGNMNVVVVGWLDSTTTISSVTDTAGNVYTLAVGPTILSGMATQAIYYAKDILPSPPNTNIVTVSFSKYATNADMRIAEYAGLDPSNPFDVAVAGQGSGTTSNSGSISTANANDLLVGANVVTASSTAAGAGFTSRVISPSGGILEDRIVAATGSYNATATLNSGSWIMQMVAFKAPTSAAPAISVAVSPASASTPTGYGTQNFAATLQNDVQRLGVAWSLSGSGCSGITCGSLSNATSTSVTYTAPANVPSPATVTITATSSADPTKSAPAIITVTQGTLNVAISPKRAAVTMTQLQQFSAVVTNDPPNAGVVWSVDGNNGGNATSGAVSSTGLFTPGTQAGVHTVTATSVSNASANVSATIAVTDFAGAFSYHYDSQSTGQNTKEYALTPATVNSSTFGLLFSCPVDGFLFASPLYVPSLTFGAQTRNVVFVATQHNSVYAFDADSPTCTQLWHTSFLSSGVMPVSPSDTGDGVSLVTEFGITSTPVIDPATTTIYVVANTKETVGSGCSAIAPCYFYRLHALDLTSGTEKFGGPVVITAPNFNALFHLQRPGLLLNNGTVYVAFGSHADLNTWQGWVMAYNATTLAQTYAWSSTVPTGGNNQGAIWGSGNPPVSDASGNVYVVTGNGTWDGTQNYSSSVVKLNSAGGVVDYFTPFDQATLSANDIDLGSAGAIILPDSVGSTLHQHLAIATGKVGVLYLLDQTNLGKFHTGANQDLQEVNIGFNTTVGDNGFFGQPAYWNGNLYTVMTADSLRQFPISNGVITNPAFSVASKIYPYRGATPSASSSGITNGIVWVEDITEYQSNGPTVLDAYDASHVATILYSSPVSGAGAACSTSKFTVPVVANGKVYVSGSNCFSVFGLLPN